MPHPIEVDLAALEYRISGPNRDKVSDAHPHLGRPAQPEGEYPADERPVFERKIPHAMDVWRAATTANSSSGEVSYSVFYSIYSLR